MAHLPTGICRLSGLHRTARFLPRRRSTMNSLFSFLGVLYMIDAVADVFEVQEAERQPLRRENARLKKELAAQMKKQEAKKVEQNAGEEAS
ncbi:unnamed protein product [Urochloa humidicola]